MLSLLAGLCLKLIIPLGRLAIDVFYNPSKTLEEIIWPRWGTPARTLSPYPTPTSPPSSTPHVLVITATPTRTNTPSESIQYIQKVVHEFENHVGMVTSLAWSPGGNTLAWGGLDGNVWLWDLEEEFDTLEKHTSSVYALDFSPNGDRLCSGDLDNMMYIWDVEEKEVIRKLERHPAGVTSIAWSPDGRYLASAGDDGVARVWGK
ncbi:MAG: hypothetical protein R6U51_12345 [Anaerolineales bacterium]